MAACSRARGAEALIRLAEMGDIPVVTTLMARGAFPDSHELNLGMPGMHGNYTAVTAIQQADLLIAMGARFDDRVTGKVSAFAPDAKVIHVDIDPAEHGKVRRPEVSVVGDCRLAMEAMISQLNQVGGSDAFADHIAWRQQLSGWQEKYPLTYEPSAPGEYVKPQQVLEAPARRLPDRHDRGVGRRSASDVGQPVLAVRASLHVDQLRWSRHDGVLDPSRHRGQGRFPQPTGVGGRRRRLFPDDRPGAKTLWDQMQRLLIHRAPMRLPRFFVDPAKRVQGTFFGAAVMLKALLKHARDRALAAADRTMQKQYTFLDAVTASRALERVDQILQCLFPNRKRHPFRHSWDRRRTDSGCVFPGPPRTCPFHRT